MLVTIIKKCLNKSIRYKETVSIIIEIIYQRIFSRTLSSDYHSLKPEKHRVNLFDYHPEWESYGKDTRYNNTRYNLGDALGLPITKRMLEKKGYRIDEYVNKTKFLYTVGSSLFASQYRNATVWGTGSVTKYENLLWFLKYPFLKLDVRAVRGPLTRDLLLNLGHKCPEVYGDPAILMPLIYKPELTKKRDLLVISQFVFEKQFRQEHPQYDIVSMNTNDYEYVIDEIVSSRLVISSSLHGIILAEAYGIPAIFFRALDKKYDFKYLDYYYSTGRYDITIAETFEEALNTEPLPLPDLSKLQNGLSEAFPYDLWDTTKKQRDC